MSPVRFHLILELYPKETFLKRKMCRYKEYKIQRIRVSWGGAHKITGRARNSKKSFKWMHGNRTKKKTLA